MSRSDRELASSGLAPPFSMDRRPLGRTGLMVSPLGFGAASLWGMPYMSEPQAHSCLAAALEGGVRYIDTGPTYSRSNAEPRLARFLASYPGRHDLVVSTKAGTRVGRWGRLVKDFSPGWIRLSVEASLRRLRLEQLPLLLLHGPKLADLNTGLLTALEKLRQDGLVAHFGVSSFESSVLECLPSWRLFEVAMLDYNLTRLDREPLIEKLSAAGIGILAGKPLAQHTFSGRPLSIQSPQDIWYLARILRHRPSDLMLFKKFSFMAGQAIGATPSQLALAFVLENPHVSAAVFSTTRPAHVRENMAAIHVSLPESIQLAIRRANGFLPDHPSVKSNG